MSNTLTIATVETEFNNLAPQIAALLPPDVPADKFRSVALAAIRNNTDLLLKCEPRSLFDACLNAAQDGLMPDGREGAIVPRKGKAVWQPMIQGIYKRVKSSGSVAGLSANVVYEGETFEVLLGDEDRIIHRRDMALVQRGKEVAVYAIASLKDGTKEREVMTWDQVEAVRQSSSMPNSGPWTLWADEMARKTVVRRLAKRLPVIEPADEALHRTINRVDSLYDFGTPQPERPVIESDAHNAEVPLKAVAASMQRPPRISEPPNQPTAEVKLPPYREFLKSLEIALRQCNGMDAVNKVIANPKTQYALQTYKHVAKEELDALITEATDRFGKIPNPEDEIRPDDADDWAGDPPDLEIVGAEKMASG
jgi:phage RecT family recombinase